MFLLCGLLLCFYGWLMDGSTVWEEVVKLRSLLALAVGLSIVAVTYWNIDPGDVLRRRYSLRALFSIYAPAIAFALIAFPEAFAGPRTTWHRLSTARKVSWMFLFLTLAACAVLAGVRAILSDHRTT